MAYPDWLEFANRPGESAIPRAFLISLIEERYKVAVLPGGFLVFKEDGISVSFAVLTDAGGYVATNGETITEGECIFHGDGVAGSLRECRHTRWGVDGSGGYIFNPPGPLIAAAFMRLAEFFDGMV